ncbi:MAG: hypothetical protein AAFV95_25440 [Bacteroidota bacterium]
MTQGGVQFDGQVLISETDLVNDWKEWSANHFDVNFVYGQMLLPRFWMQLQTQHLPLRPEPDRSPQYDRRFEVEGRYYLLNIQERSFLNLGLGARFAFDDPEMQFWQRLYGRLGADFTWQAGLFLSPAIRFGMSPNDLSQQFWSVQMDVRFVQVFDQSSMEGQDIVFQSGGFYIHPSAFRFVSLPAPNGQRGNRWSLQSRFGYFITPFLVAGAEVSVQSLKEAELTQERVVWDIGQFFRLYVNPRRGNKKFFAELAWNRKRSSELFSFGANYEYWFRYGGGLGSSLFLTTNLAAEFRLSYWKGQFSEVIGFQRLPTDWDSESLQIECSMQYFLN